MFAVSRFAVPTNKTPLKVPFRKRKEKKDKPVVHSPPSQSKEESDEEAVAQDKAVQGKNADEAYSSLKDGTAVVASVTHKRSRDGAGAADLAEEAAAKRTKTEKDSTEAVEAVEAVEDVEAMDDLDAVSSKADRHPKSTSTKDAFLPRWVREGKVLHVQTKRPVRDFAFSPFISKTLIGSGIKDFFPIQAEVIPAILKRRRWNDVCVSAPTGSGKTLAYVLPIIHALAGRQIIRLRAVHLLICANFP